MIIRIVHNTDVTKCESSHSDGGSVFYQMLISFVNIENEREDKHNTSDLGHDTAPYVPRNDG